MVENDLDIDMKDIISCVGHLKYRTSNMSQTIESDIQPIINKKDIFIT